MFNQLLPPRIDNVYRGHRLALWLFAVVVAVRIAQGLLVIFGGASIARSADGIPLETFTPRRRTNRGGALRALCALPPVHLLAVRADAC